MVLRGVHRVSTVREARELAERLVRHGDPLRDVQREVVQQAVREAGCRGTHPRRAAHPGAREGIAAGLTGDDEGPSCVGLPG